MKRNRHNKKDILLYYYPPFSKKETTVIVEKLLANESVTIAIKKTNPKVFMLDSS